MVLHMESKLNVITFVPAVWQMLLKEAYYVKLSFFSFTSYYNVIRSEKLTWRVLFWVLVLEVQPWRGFVRTWRSILWRHSWVCLTYGVFWLWDASGIHSRIPYFLFLLSLGSTLQKELYLIVKLMTVKYSYKWKNMFIL